MTMAARKTVSIHDYPEHLNPFREDDNHNKLRFWTMGRKLNRSNSINFSVKELKNSWAFRSFMRKGKKQAPAQESKPQENGDVSPIVYRRALQYTTASVGARSTVGSPESADRYVYGGSITPLPRSRFQERLRSTSQQEVSSLCASPRLERSEVCISRLSVDSTNPFDECPPVPPVRASRRKKKRAAPLPPAAATADVSVTSETSEITQIAEKDEKKEDTEQDLEDDLNLNVELKIVEDEDLEKPNAVPDSNGNVVSEKVEAIIETEPKLTIIEENVSEIKEESPIKPPRAEDKNNNPDVDMLNSVSFPKVDIVKYRRNSSVNEDDIRLRRGNIEDFHALNNKRSKSLTNTVDTFVTYDINLNDNRTADANGNEEPQKVICKLYENTSRKHSIDTISSTEREFMEIDKVRREIEQEVSKLNAALEEDFSEPRMSVSDIKKKFDKDGPSSPNPIPKPKRSITDSESNSPVNGNIRYVN